MSQVTITPVIMSGGAGSRLWPLSRKAMPKQLLPLVTERTMVQETVARVTGPMFSAPVFICNALHAGPIAQQMEAVGQTGCQIIVEPAARNTAPCAAVAALHTRQTNPGGLTLLLPADHHVTNSEAFVAAVKTAIPAAQKGQLVTFGIKAAGPETGYGYIARGAQTDPGVFDVTAFKEKPDLETAKSYVASGDYDWNAGIFLFSPETFLAEIAVHSPETAEHATKAYASAANEGAVMTLGAADFAHCPSKSIDYAVMEKTDRAAVVPCDIGWSDIGSYTSLRDIRLQERGTAISGTVFTADSANNFIQTDSLPITAIGVDNLAIIVHEGEILVVGLEHAQSVKKIVEELKTSGQNKRL